MLDLDHPQARFIFAMADEEAAITAIALQITAVDTEARQILLLYAYEHFDNMHAVLVKGWGVSQSKSDAIHTLQTQLQHLAMQPSQNNFDATGSKSACDVCGSQRQTLLTHPKDSYCPTCFDSVSTGRQAVSDAFGLWCI
ncbi:MAG: hypothetical protein ACPG8W_15520 [Candidatus Promineifilaceae bacterium]